MATGPTAIILVEDLERIGKLLSGLQAPASMGGPQILGAAYEPWAEIHGLTGFGWKDPEQYMMGLTSRANAHVER